MLKEGLVFAAIFLSLQADAEPRCEKPYWNSPAESQQGVFRGDLAMDCFLPDPLLEGALESLKKGVIKKIEAESTIHEGPLTFQDGGNEGLQWDVSHTLVEEGSPVTIREKAMLLKKGEKSLIYRTRSKEVLAKGMAGYLRSVGFSMILSINEKHLAQIKFSNDVTVERPWFALDLIFAPIARNVCFQKMEQVKLKLLPWIVDLLKNSKQPVSTG